MLVVCGASPAQLLPSLPAAVCGRAPPGLSPRLLLFSAVMSRSPGGGIVSRSLPRCPSRVPVASTHPCTPPLPTLPPVLSTCCSALVFQHLLFSTCCLLVLFALACRSLGSGGWLSPRAGGACVQSCTPWTRRLPRLKVLLGLQLLLGVPAACCCRPQAVDCQCMAFARPPVRAPFAAAD